MATSLNQLPAWNPDSGLLNVIVDTPKGCRNKYKYDEEHGLWRLSKVLPLGASFPFDFGFIPSTRGEDGDPIDALVLLDEHAFPGCVVPARLIGVLEAEQTEKGKTVRNDRLVTVVETPYNPPMFHSLEELDPQSLDEVEHFFISYNQMEGRQFKSLGRQGPEKAQEMIDAAMLAYAQARKGPGRSRSRSKK
jgi:inorganic pyrophosphatase